MKRTADNMMILIEKVEFYKANLLECWSDKSDVNISVLEPYLKKLAEVYETYGLQNGGRCPMKVADEVRECCEVITGVLDEMQ